MGKGTSSGISYLFRTMGRFLGLEVEYIAGYAKYDYYYLPKKPPSYRYAWNAIKIDNSYYLIDAIMGADRCAGDYATLGSFDDYQFCTKPEYFIRHHLPVESKWQLMTNIITYKQFNDWAFLINSFYTNDFLTISPDKNTIDIYGKTKINITYDKSNKNVVIHNNIYYYEDNKWRGTTDNLALYYTSNGNIEIDIIANKKTKYLHNINGFPTNETFGDIPWIAQIVINNLKESDDDIYFPFQYLPGRNTKLIEPLYNNLTKGTFVDFKIKSNIHDKIIITIGSTIRELEKLNDGIFYGKSIHILGNSVNLFGMKENEYEPLYNYDVLKNPNIEEVPELPPHVLYSPLFDTLEKGKSYYFKIKCEYAQLMFVLDDVKNIFELDKNGTTFSKQITINNTASELGIVGLLLDSSYALFYIYNISNY